jgi:exopolyphosphatase/guanosine-5'-triphosphate,3'-diphosphate pyrophosphatase
MRIAALDIGTNTVLLLIVESDAPPDFRVVQDRHAIARLGENVDKTSTISDEAFQRFRHVLIEHLDAIRDHHVDIIRAIATSAMRDAKNAYEIVQRIEKEFSIKIEIIPGGIEAGLTFRGALAGLTLPETAKRIAVLDIGGGSTELSFGTPTAFVNGTSMNIGALRMTERLGQSTGERKQNLVMVTDEIRQNIQSPFASKQEVDSLVAVAGTPTTLAAMAMELESFDENRIHGYELALDIVERLLAEIQSLSLDELTSRYRSVHPGRADILFAGSLILRESMIALGLSRVTVSTHGLRYGIAMMALDEQFQVAGTHWHLSVA